MFSLGAFSNESGATLAEDASGDRPKAGLLTDTKSIDDIKTELRKRAHAARAALDGDMRAEAAQALAGHFQAAFDLADGAVIAAYWPIRDEVDCRAVLTRLVDAGQPVCLPVARGAERPLEFRVWEAGAPLFPSGFGTLAPADDAPRAEPDYVLIPLLGFDGRGTRLGYGGGYYDRTLAALGRKPVVVGFAYSVQELPEIPRAPHDIPLDFIVTEAGVRRFSHEDAGA